MGFIDTGYERLGFGPSTNGVIDTLELSRTINTEYGKHGLNFLAKSMASNSHNTIEPFMIQRLRPIFIKMVQQMKELGVNNHNEINKNLRMKMHIKSSTITCHINRSKPRRT